MKLSDRILIIETKFKTIIEPMANQVQFMYDQMPEMVRKVNKHHETYSLHCDFINTRIKQLQEDKEKANNMRRRQTDTKFYKLKVIILIVAIISVLATNFWVLIKLL